MITPHPVKTQSPAPASARRPVPRALGIGTPRIIAGCALAAPAAGHHACSRRLGSRPHWARESCGPIGNIETCRRCDSINGPLYVTELSSDSRRPSPMANVAPLPERRSSWSDLATVCRKDRSWRHGVDGDPVGRAWKEGPRADRRLRRGIRGKVPALRSLCFDSDQTHRRSV
jgi:hypothetical protein